MQTKTQIMMNYFTVNEFTKIVLIKDGHNPIVSLKSMVSVLGALKHWLTKGVVERLERGVTDVKWRLKQKLFYPYFNGFNRQNLSPFSTIPLLRNLTSIRLTVL